MAKKLPKPKYAPKKSGWNIHLPLPFGLGFALHARAEKSVFKLADIEEYNPVLFKYLKENTNMAMTKDGEYGRYAMSAKSLKKISKLAYSLPEGSPAKDFLLSIVRFTDKIPSAFVTPLPKPIENREDFLTKKWNANPELTRIGQGTNDEMPSGDPNDPEYKKKLLEWMKRQTSMPEKKDESTDAYLTDVRKKVGVEASKSLNQKSPEFTLEDLQSYNPVLFKYIDENTNLHFGRGLYARNQKVLENITRLLLDLPEGSPAKEFLQDIVKLSNEHQPLPSGDRKTADRELDVLRRIEEQIERKDLPSLDPEKVEEFRESLETNAEELSAVKIQEMAEGLKNAGMNSEEVQDMIKRTKERITKNKFLDEINLPEDKIEEYRNKGYPLSFYTKKDVEIKIMLEMSIYEDDDIYQGITREKLMDVLWLKRCLGLGVGEFMPLYQLNKRELLDYPIDTDPPGAVRILPPNVFDFDLDDWSFWNERAKFDQNMFKIMGGMTTWVEDPNFQVSSVQTDYGETTGILGAKKWHLKLRDNSPKGFYSSTKETLDPRLLLKDGFIMALTDTQMKTVSRASEESMTRLRNTAQQFIDSVRYNLPKNKDMRYFYVQLHPDWNTITKWEHSDYAQGQISGNTGNILNNIANNLDRFVEYAKPFYQFHLVQTVTDVKKILPERMMTDFINSFTTGQLEGLAKIFEANPEEFNFGVIFKKYLQEMYPDKPADYQFSIIDLPYEVGFPHGAALLPRHAMRIALNDLLAGKIGKAHRGTGNWDARGERNVGAYYSVKKDGRNVHPKDAYHASDFEILEASILKVILDESREIFPKIEEVMLSSAKQAAHHLALAQVDALKAAYLNIVSSGLLLNAKMAEQNLLGIDFKDIKQLTQFISDFNINLNQLTNPDQVLTYATLVLSDGQFKTSLQSTQRLLDTRHQFVVGKIDALPDTVDLLYLHAAAEAPLTSDMFKNPEDYDRYLATMERSWSAIQSNSNIPQITKDSLVPVINKFNERLQEAIKPENINENTYPLVAQYALMQNPDLIKTFVSQAEDIAKDTNPALEVDQESLAKMQRVRSLLPDNPSLLEKVNSAFTQAILDKKIEYIKSQNPAYAKMAKGEELTPEERESVEDFDLALEEVDQFPLQLGGNEAIEKVKQAREILTKQEEEVVEKPAESKQEERENQEVLPPSPAPSPTATALPSPTQKPALKHLEEALRQHYRQRLIDEENTRLQEIENALGTEVEGKISKETINEILRTPAGQWPNTIMLDAYATMGTYLLNSDNFEGLSSSEKSEKKKILEKWLKDNKDRATDSYKSLKAEQILPKSYTPVHINEGRYNYMREIKKQRNNVQYVEGRYPEKNPFEDEHWSIEPTVENQYLGFTNSSHMMKNWLKENQPTEDKDLDLANRYFAINEFIRMAAPFFNGKVIELEKGQYDEFKDDAKYKKLVAQRIARIERIFKETDEIRKELEPLLKYSLEELKNIPYQETFVISVEDGANEYTHLLYLIARISFIYHKLENFGSSKKFPMQRLPNWEEIKSTPLKWLMHLDAIIDKRNKKIAQRNEEELRKKGLLQEIEGSGKQTKGDYAYIPNNIRNAISHQLNARKREILAQIAENNEFWQGMPPGRYLSNRKLYNELLEIEEKLNPVPSGMFPPVEPIHTPLPPAYRELTNEDYMKRQGLVPRKEPSGESVPIDNAPDRYRQGMSEIAYAKERKQQTEKQRQIDEFNALNKPVEPQALPIPRHADVIQKEYADAEYKKETKRLLKLKSDWEKADKAEKSRIADEYKKETNRLIKMRDDWGKEQLAKADDEYERLIDEMERRDKIEKKLFPPLPTPNIDNMIKMLTPKPTAIPTPLPPKFIAPSNEDYTRKMGIASTPEPSPMATPRPREIGPGYSARAVPITPLPSPIASPTDIPTILPTMTAMPSPTQMLTQMQGVQKQEFTQIVSDTGIEPVPELSARPMPTTMPLQPPKQEEITAGQPSVPPKEIPQGQQVKDANASLQQLSIEQYMNNMRLISQNDKTSITNKIQSIMSEDNIKKLVQSRVTIDEILPEVLAENDNQKFVLNMIKQLISLNVNKVKQTKFLDRRNVIPKTIASIRTLVRDSLKTLELPLEMQAQFEKDLQREDFSREVHEIKKEEVQFKDKEFIDKKFLDYDTIFDIEGFNSGYNEEIRKLVRGLRRKLERKIDKYGYLKEKHFENAEGTIIKQIEKQSPNIARKAKSMLGKIGVSRYAKNLLDQDQAQDQDQLVWGTIPNLLKEEQIKSYVGITDDPSLSDFSNAVIDEAIRNYKYKKLPMMLAPKADKDYGQYEWQDYNKSILIPYLSGKAKEIAKARLHQGLYPGVTETDLKSMMGRIKHINKFQSHQNEGLKKRLHKVNFPSQFILGRNQSQPFTEEDLAHYNAAKEVYEQESTRLTSLYQDKVNKYPNFLESLYPAKKWMSDKVIRRENERSGIYNLFKNTWPTVAESYYKDDVPKNVDRNTFINDVMSRVPSLNIKEIKNPILQNKVSGVSQRDRLKMLGNRKTFYAPMLNNLYNFVYKPKMF